MNKFSYVNTKHYNKFGVFIVTILSHNYNFASKFSNWYIMLIIPSYVCNEYQKIGSCRFKNDILLYLASVTNASVI